jgi:single-stranded-DNA-specific exonuclease
MDKFGGHAMAAGLSLAHDKLAQFADAFEAVAREGLSAEQLRRVHVSDGPLDEALSSVDAVRSMESAVWGQGFPAPTFDETVQVVEHRVVAGKHSKLRLRRGDGSLVTALCWNEPNVPTAQIHIVFRPTVNTFQGVSAVEFVIDAWCELDS